MKKILTLLGTLAVLLMGTITALADEPIWAFLPDVKTDTNWSYWGDMAAYKVEYPILEYSDTLYLPMTLRNCVDLGMAMAWQDNALYLTYCGKDGRFGTMYYGIYDQPWRFECYHATHPVYLNGKEVLGSVDGMPILNYQGVTYLPLTEAILRELRLELRWYEYFQTLNIDHQYQSPKYRFYGIYAEENGRIDYVLYRYLYLGNQTTNGYYAYNSFDGANVVNNGRYKSNYSFGNVDADPRPEVFPELTSTDVTERLRWDNGKLMYGAAELKSRWESPVSSAKEYTFWDGVSMLEVYTEDWRQDYFIANGAFVPCSLYFDPHDIYETMLRLRTEDGSVYFTDFDHSFFAIAPDGQVSAITDEDHNYFKLVGYIDGRPLVEALWYGEIELDGVRTGGLISPVNDGFFTLEKDGSLKKYLDYRYNDSAFVLNDRLYLVDMYENCFIDTTTGEEIPFDDADQS